MTRKSVTCFAPATVANVAVGFDILGFSFPAIGDEVTVTRTESGVVVDGVRSLSPLVSPSECAAIPLDASRNTATAGLLRMVEDLGSRVGFRVAVAKAIPLGSGMGGSAASAVGALVAANELLDEKLPKERLLEYALVGEQAASGARHPDNVTPCLYGGLTLTRSIDPLDVIELEVPRGVHCVLVHPHARLDTKKARAVLSPSIALADHVRQSANLAAFIAACFRSDLDLVGRSLQDVLVEPQRAPLIAGFSAAKAAALAHGALGCSISGSGPSIFAWTRSESQALAVRDAVVAAIAAAGVGADAWTAPLSREGARIIETRGAGGN